MEGRVANILIDTFVKTIQILGNGITAAYTVMVTPYANISLKPPPPLKRCYCSGAFENGNCICNNKPMSYKKDVILFPSAIEDLPIFASSIEDLPRPLNNV